MAPKATVGRNRGRWAWRCAIFGTAAALGSAGARSMGLGSRPLPTFVGTRSSHGVSGLRLRLKAVGDDIQAGVDDVVGKVQKSVTDVVEAPGRLQKEAQATIDSTIEKFSKDDGKVLDTESPSGVVGALAVSLAILPYIPISLYSTYILATTGKGVPAGPNGLFGLAEGLATVVVFAVVAWSIISFLTRARGLPAGPFNLLGATQSLSFLSAILLSVVSAIGGKNIMSSLSGFKGVKFDVPAISMPDTSKLKAPEGLNLPKVEVPKFDMPKVDVPKVEVPKFDMPKVNVPKVDVPKFDVPKVNLPAAPKVDLSGLNKIQEGIAAKVEAVKDKVEDAQEAVSDKLSDIGDEAKEAAGKAKEAAGKATQSLKPAAEPAKPAAPKPAAPAPAPAPAKEAAKPKAPAKAELDIEDLF